MTEALRNSALKDEKLKNLRTDLKEQDVVTAGGKHRSCQQRRIQKITENGQR